MQIPNARGFAGYKSFGDTQSVFLGEEFSLIFHTFPCFSEKKQIVCGSEVNLRAESG